MACAAVEESRGDRGLGAFASRGLTDQGRSRPGTWTWLSKIALEPAARIFAGAPRLSAGDRPMVVAVQFVNDHGSESAISFARRHQRVASEAPGKQRFAYRRCRSASKIPYLLECAEKIIGGHAPDWPDVHKFLNSHQQKLMANLMNFKRVQSPSKVPAKGTAAWEDAVARVRQMDRFKQDGFYVCVEDTGSSARSEKFDQARTGIVLELAKVSFNTSDLMGRGFDAKQAGETQMNLRPRYS